MTGHPGARGPAARLLLFAGFLGSGKTTLILSLARHEALAGLRICVIVNEVGEVGIDGEVLRPHSARVGGAVPAPPGDRRGIGHRHPGRRT